MRLVTGARRRTRSKTDLRGRKMWIMKKNRSRSRMYKNSRSKWSMRSRGMRTRWIMRSISIHIKRKMSVKNRNRDKYNISK